MRKPIVAGNWKMNKTFQEAEELTDAIVKGIEKISLGETEVVLCPPAPFLEMVLDLTDETYVAVGAQNVNDHESGAFTGEISALMLQSMHLEYCITGHSERRHYFHETDALLAGKVNALLKAGIIPIYCCGETLPEREKGNHREVVREQLKQGLFHLGGSHMQKVVIAYEPVWAIGTGVTATPPQAQEMHAWIRQLIRETYGEAIAGEISILYGGSCNAANAASLFALEDVDGGLIGGASLKAGEFLEIVRIAAV